MDWYELIITVLGATIIFCLEDFAKRLFIDPLEKYRALRGEISYALSYYAQFYANPCINNGKGNADDNQKEKYLKVSDELRNLASKLYSCAEMRYSFQPGMPRKERLTCAAKALIGLSNNLFTWENNMSFTIEHEEYLLHN